MSTVVTSGTLVHPCPHLRFFVADDTDLGVVVDTVAGQKLNNAVKVRGNPDTDVFCYPCVKWFPCH